MRILDMRFRERQSVCFGQLHHGFVWAAAFKAPALARCRSRLQDPWIDTVQSLRYHSRQQTRRLCSHARMMCFRTALRIDPPCFQTLRCFPWNFQAAAVGGQIKLHTQHRAA